MRHSKKGWDKRKKDREGLSEFFENCIQDIKNNNLCCKECGEKLKGHASEVAHILPKSYFRSIQTDPLNWLPLCGMYSANQCHTNFDNFKNEDVKEMNIFSTIEDRFLKLEEKVTEKIPWKIYEKYTKD